MNRHKEETKEKKGKQKKLYDCKRAIRPDTERFGVANGGCPSGTILNKETGWCEVRTLLVGERDDFLKEIQKNKKLTVEEKDVLSYCVVTEYDRAKVLLHREIDKHDSWTVASVMKVVSTGKASLRRWITRHFGGFLESIFDLLDSIEDNQPKDTPKTWRGWFTRKKKDMKENLKRKWQKLRNWSRWDTLKTAGIGLSVLPLIAPYFIPAVPAAAAAAAAGGKAAAAAAAAGASGTEAISKAVPQGGILNMLGYSASAALNTAAATNTAAMYTRNLYNMGSVEGSKAALLLFGSATGIGVFSQLFAGDMYNVMLYTIRKGASALKVAMRFVLTNYVLAKVILFMIGQLRNYVCDHFSDYVTGQSEYFARLRDKYYKEFADMVMQNEFTAASSIYEIFESTWNKLQQDKEFAYLKATDMLMFMKECFLSKDSRLFIRVSTSMGETYKAGRASINLITKFMGFRSNDTGRGMLDAVLDWWDGFSELFYSSLEVLFAAWVDEMNHAYRLTEARETIDGLFDLRKCYMRAFFSGLKRELNNKGGSLEDLSLRRRNYSVERQYLHNALEKIGKYMVFDLDPEEFTEKVFGKSDRVFLEKNFGIHVKFDPEGRNPKIAIAQNFVSRELHKLFRTEPYEVVKLAGKVGAYVGDLSRYRGMDFSGMSMKKAGEAARADRAVIKEATGFVAGVGAAAGTAYAIDMLAGGLGTAATLTSVLASVSAAFVTKRVTSIATEKTLSYATGKTEMGFMIGDIAQLRKELLGLFNSLITDQRLKGGLISSEDHPLVIESEKRIRMAYMAGASKEIREMAIGMTVLSIMAGLFKIRPPPWRRENGGGEKEMSSTDKDPRGPLLPELGGSIKFNWDAWEEQERQRSRAVESEARTYTDEAGPTSTDLARDWGQWVTMDLPSSVGEEESFTSVTKKEEQEEERQQQDATTKGTVEGENGEKRQTGENNPSWSSRWNSLYEWMVDDGGGKDEHGDPDEAAVRRNRGSVFLDDVGFGDSDGSEPAAGASVTLTKDGLARLQDRIQEINKKKMKEESAGWFNLW